MQQQQAHALQRGLEGLRRRPGSWCVMVAGSVSRAASSHRVHGLPERDARAQVERDRHRGQLAQVRHRERSDAVRQLRDGAQRHQLAARWTRT